MTLPSSCLVLYTFHCQYCSLSLFQMSPMILKHLSLSWVSHLIDNHFQLFFSISNWTAYSQITKFNMIKSEFTLFSLKIFLPLSYPLEGWFKLHILTIVCFAPNCYPFPSKMCSNFSWCKTLLYFAFPSIHFKLFNKIYMFFHTWSLLRFPFTSVSLSLSYLYTAAKLALSPVSYAIYRLSASAYLPLLLHFHTIHSQIYLESTSHPGLP